MTSLHQSRWFAFSLILAFALICGIEVAVTFAQGEQAVEENQKNSLARGAWGLQFQITDNFRLTSFQGSTIGAKRHYSDKRAIRFGLGLSASVADEERKSKRAGQNETSLNNEFLGFNVHYLVYPSPKKHVNLCFGGGPLMSFSHSSSTNSPSEIGTRTKVKTTNWSAGISGVLGAEWFAARSISLIAEYASSIEYASTHRKETSEFRTGDSGYILNDEIVTDTQAFLFRPSSVKFGMSVYF